MGFKWLCPCGVENQYNGKLTTDAVTSCPTCGYKYRIWKYKIIEAINPKIPFNKNRFFGSNFLTDLKKEIAELKVGSVRQTEILKVITEGRILELDAYNRLESVLKERIEKLENDSFYWRGQVSDSRPPEQFESYTIIEEDEEKRVIQCNKPKPPEPTLPNPFKMEYSRDEVAILLKKQKQDLIAEFIQDIDGYLESCVPMENTIDRKYWRGRKRHWGAKLK